LGAMAELALELSYQEREPFVPLTGEIPKRKRTYKQQDNGDIMAFLSIISATPDFAYRSQWAQGGCRHVYVRTQGKNENGEIVDKFRKIVHFHQGCTETTERVGSVKFRQSHDYYISKNSFFADKRTKSALFSYDNIVIDLDVHGWNLSRYEKDLDYQINKLIYLLQNEYEGKFPAFNAVRSGRGCQLWIGLESFSALVEAFRRRYTAVCDYFCTFLKAVIEDNNLDLEVDYGASTDATRLARIPYTYNQHRYNKRTHKGYITQFEHLTDYRYSLDEIQEFIISPEKKPRKRERVNPTGDFTALNIKRVRFIEKITERTDGQCVGRRENLAFFYYNALIQIGEQTTAEQKLRKLNEHFTEPLPESQIKAIIAEFKRKGENIGKTLTGGYAETGYYAISTDKFLKSIQATENERFEYVGATSRELDRKAARAKKAERDRRIEELTEQGMSYKDIADEIGCSESTVRRKDIAKQSKADRDAQIMKLKAQGLSTRDIATVVGCSKNTVTATLKRNEATPTQPSTKQKHYLTTDLPFDTSATDDDLPFDIDDTETDLPFDIDNENNDLPITGVFFSSFLEEEKEPKEETLLSIAMNKDRRKNKNTGGAGAPKNSPTPETERGYCHRPPPPRGADMKNYT